MAVQPNRISIIILGAGVLAALLLLANQGPDTQYWSAKLAGWTGSTPTTITNSFTESPVMEDQQGIVGHIEKSLAGGNTEDPIDILSTRDPMALNQMGVSLVSRKKMWEGLAYFDKAIQLDPSRILPIINMAAVLTEMGLSRPAARYISMAETLNPDHPWLQRNFGIGDNAGKPQ